MEKEKKQDEIQKALFSAYNVCIQVADFTGNVLASEKKEDWEKSDINNLKDAKCYIKWFEKTFKTKNIK